ncbi:hypothetical protein CPT_Merlin148 [Citrobacter phage Merlin]|uniref:Uncharacterized protein n=1 Tax=Citrobacter phage Merlin TaxID=1675602 RepID=A0A0K1LMU6_9CAUD|nr:hypothetical protein CPT_Merlin148 [Citrobacter phage Merlin]AKU43794.1 hypothetical protein CPT_Merlin148 [Citrobacter phage Merlin]
MKLANYCFGHGLARYDVWPKSPSYSLGWWFHSFMIGLMLIFISLPASMMYVKETDRVISDINVVLIALVTAVVTVFVPHITYLTYFYLKRLNYNVQVFVHNLDYKKEKKREALEAELQAARVAQNKKTREAMEFVMEMRK